MKDDELMKFMDERNDKKNLELKVELKEFIRTEIQACSVDKMKDLDDKVQKALFSLAWKLIISVSVIVTLIINLEKFFGIWK